MSQNPFDFSDFGPARRPSGPPSGPGPGFGGPPSGARPGPPSGPAAGFDPWADQSPARHGQQGAPSPAPGADVFGRSGGQHDVFGAPGAMGGMPGGALTTAGPPLVWFAVALGLAVVGFGIALAGALAGGMVVTAIAGWLLAGPVAIGALAMFTRIDTRRRTESVYSAPTWAGTLYWAVLAVCLVGIAMGAWQIALWAGRL